MTGILAQLVAITAYGNDYLKNGHLPSSFLDTNTTFQFCNRVDFRIFQKQLLSSATKEIIIAHDPAAWFEYLKKEKCKYLRLYFQHAKQPLEHKLAGLIGGGGTWLVEAVGVKYSDYWLNKWEVTQPNAGDKKIWSVSYGLAGKQQKTTDIQINVDKAREQIRETLTAIAAFAYARNLASWGKQFDNAKMRLDSEHPAQGYYHQDIIPFINYSLTAQQLLMTAGAAWVFGGMGSWNDLGFANQQDQLLYDSLSEQLYDNIIEAVIASVNSF